MADIEEEDEFAHLPHLSGKCQIMWHENYWDGPMSGVLLYEGKMHYFNMIDQYDCDEDPDFIKYDDDDEENETDYWKWYRKHALYELEPEDQVRLVTLHALWQSHVGLHTDYWPFNGRGLRLSKAKEKMKKQVEQNQALVLHYGPSGDRECGWEEYQALKKHWVLKYGDYSHKDKTPIGFIYHEQLYGLTVGPDGVSVETDESE